jgi:hypothetical protein
MSESRIRLEIVKTDQDIVRAINGSEVASVKLLCEVQINDESRVVEFRWNDHLKLFRSFDSVAVWIPEYSTDRARRNPLPDYRTYHNRVRKSPLFIEQTSSGYSLVEEFKVMDAIAIIVSWCDDTEPSVSQDHIIPRPIKRSN